MKPYPEVPLTDYAFPVRLPKRYLLRIDRPAGVRIFCIEGGLWITQLGDIRDHFLGAGDALALQPEGSVIIHAMRDTWCQVVHRTHADFDIRVKATERLVLWRTS